MGDLQFERLEDFFFPFLALFYFTLFVLNTYFVLKFLQSFCVV